MAHSDEIVVRPLRPEDEAEWRRMWRAYLEFYEATRPEEVYATTFARMLSGQPGEFRALIAELGGRPVGLAHYLFHRTGWEIAETCYLQDLYADPAVRGAGVGRALIEAVYTRADAANAPSVYWLTQDFNQTARKLYDRVGELTPFVKYQRS